MEVTRGKKRTLRGQVNTKKCNKKKSPLPQEGVAKA